MALSFLEKLRKGWGKGNFICVGLDTDIDRLPEHLWEGRRIHQAVMIDFNRQIVAATAEIALAYKPNYAFYESVGEPCTATLRGTVSCIRQEYGLPVILDVKRGDIDSTNEAYARAELDNLNVDAVTINPYLGMTANEPFLKREDKGVIVLCRTSNKEGGEFQDLKAYLSHDELEKLDAKMPLPKEVVDTWEAHVSQYHQQPGFLVPLYQIVAMRVSRIWNTNRNCALVVGATYPKELGIVRKLVGDLTILCPGGGVQGGSLKDALENGLNSQKQGLILNYSRSVIFASKGKDFAEAAGQAAMKLHEEVHSILKSRDAGGSS